MVRKESPPGFRQPLSYTGEGKGGPCPYEGIVVSSRQHSLSYLILISPIPPQDSTNEYLDIPITHTRMKNHQIKSCWYYMLWGVATISVVVGQVYVGSGYKQMADSIEQIGKEIIKASD